MTESFYPFVDSGDEVADNRHIVGAEEHDRANGSMSAEGAEQVRYPARIAVYDDALSTPRIVVVEAKDIRTYLEDITNTVSKLAKEQGSGIPFMVIREIVENFIHASFIEPTVSILDGGNTIRFADQGPGIQNKALALEPGVSSADAHMKRYIRGVGSGFPTVQQYLDMAGGTLSIDDNMGTGTVVTVTLDPARADSMQAPKRATAPAIPAAPQDTALAGGYGAPAAAGVPAPVAPYAPQASAPMQPQQPQVYSAARQQIPAAPWAPPQGMPPYPHPYPQSYGFPQTYPQSQPMFSTTPQPAVPYGAEAGGAPAAPGVYVSERGAVALRFMQAHGQCGPTDLAQAAGSSTATWSRELATLSETGLAVKRGQKYVLTELGKTWGAA